MAEIIERDALELRGPPPFPSPLQSHSEGGMRHRFPPSPSSVHSLLSSDFTISLRERDSALLHVSLPPVSLPRRR